MRGHSNVQGQRTVGISEKPELVPLDRLAEQYGFDSVWSAEHHFDDYSMCPDNLQIMSYLAGRTERIKLGTGAVILPSSIK